MKKLFSVLLVLAMLMSLCACGSDEPVVNNNGNDYGDSYLVDPNTPSPRDQFQQTDQAIADMNKKDEVTAATPVTYSTAGISYQLDSSFSTSNNDPASTNVTYTSDVMWVTAQALANYAGYSSSQQAAEDIAALQGGTVGSGNGVYYVEEDGRIRAYYANGGDCYWCIYGFVTGGNDYNTYRSKLISFCTSGKID